VPRGLSGCGDGRVPGEWRWRGVCVWGRHVGAAWLYPRSADLHRQCLHPRCAGLGDPGGYTMLCLRQVLMPRHHHSLLKAGYTRQVSTLLCPPLGLPWRQRVSGPTVGPPDLESPRASPKSAPA
jgi:hypothetical protein